MNKALLFLALLLAFISAVLFVPFVKQVVLSAVLTAAVKTGALYIKTFPSDAQKVQLTQASAESLALMAIMQTITQVDESAPVDFAKFRADVDFAGELSAPHPLAKLKKIEVPLKTQNSFTNGSFFNVHHIEWIHAPSKLAIIFIHGGGHYAGGFKSHAAVATEIGYRAQAFVYLPEYRLAPEYTILNQIEDIVSTYSMMLANQHDPNDVFLVGDSAGGALVAMSLAKIRDSGLPMPKGGWMISPYMDLSYASKSYVSNEPTDPLTLMVTRKIRCAVLGFPHDCQIEQHRKKYQDPSISALFASLNDFPPLLVQASEQERVIDDCHAFVANAKKANVDVEFQIWKYQLHVFTNFFAYIPEGSQAIDNGVKWMQETRKK